MYSSLLECKLSIVCTVDGHLHMKSDVKDVTSTRKQYTHTQKKNKPQVVILSLRTDRELWRYM